MLALVSQRDYRCFPLGIIGSTRCCQHLCTCTVCACRGRKREPEPLGFQMAGRHHSGSGDRAVGSLARAARLHLCSPSLLDLLTFVGTSEVL